MLERSPERIITILEKVRDRERAQTAYRYARRLI